MVHCVVLRFVALTEFSTFIAGMMSGKEERNKEKTKRERVTVTG